MTNLKDVSTWYNELGSQMTLNSDSSGGLTGTYTSAVGQAQSQYPLVGRFNPSASLPALGWVVQWVNQYKQVNSVTSWSGQFQMLNNVPTILTTWLLTEQTDPKDDWQSTLVGQDVFTPNPPSAEDIKKKLKQKRHSFPTKLHR